ncbi:MAG: glycosyltransferase family 4 protein [Phycisphaeraceae bacterium]|nr:glycosyltransferase family 4 protein [Phycisphaeraceae bacterium]
MTAPMRINFILPYPNLSGGVRVLAIYADRLRRRGHQVHVICSLHRRPTMRRAFGQLLRGQGWPWTPPPDPRHFDDLNVPIHLLESPRPVRDGDVPDGDVVVATWWRTAQWVMDLSPSKGAKAYFMQDYGASGQEMRQIVPTWSMPMHLITISDYLRTLILREVDVPVSLAANGVDSEQFHAPPRGKQDKPTFGTLYSRTPEKGSDLILQALRLLRNSGQDFRVVGFGPHPPREHEPLLEQDEFHWQAPNDALAAIYSRCDAWLYGVRCEGFGLPILEAMACRTPVIATPAGAAPELIAGGGGVLVEHDNPQAMADQMQRVINMSDAEWRQWSDEAYANAQNHTWDAATDQFEAALRLTIERATDTTAMKD